MANKKISELTVKSSPSTSATLVGVDNGETVQVPITAVVTTGNFPVADEDTIGGVKVKLEGTTLTISTN